MLVQAVWVKRVDPGSKAIYCYGVYGAAFVMVFVGAFSGDEVLEAASTGINIVGGVVGLFGYFNVKNSLEEYYGGPPIHLDLSGVMTFFFNTVYFQYHFTRINKWHRTGVLPA